MGPFSASYLSDVTDRLSGRLIRAQAILLVLLHGFAGSSQRARPKRMLQGNRGVDDKFLPRHALYHRIKKEDLISDRMNPARIRCENTSVNWSKYSKPWDATFDYPGCGVVRFMVRDLPRELPKEPNPKTKPRSFFPIHDPKPTNYAHSEIGTFTGGMRVPKPSLGKIVTKEFQNIMSNRSFVILLPRI